VAPAPTEFASKAAALVAEEDAELLPCRHCGRNFKLEAHAKHENICQKVFQNKRKVYNTTDHRLPDDPALAEVRRKAAQQARKGKVGIGEEHDTVKKNGWRAKSEAFRAAMKDAQVVKKFQREGRPLSELPPPAATAPELDDRTQCPHCGRRFGEQQAQRHIPLCAKKVQQVKPSAAGRQLAAAPTLKGAPKRRNA